MTYENLRWIAAGRRGRRGCSRFLWIFFFLGHINYLPTLKISVAFSMNFSAEAIMALAPD